MLVAAPLLHLSLLLLIWLGTICGGNTHFAPCNFDVRVAHDSSSGCSIFQHVLSTIDGKNTSHDLNEDHIIVRETTLALVQRTSTLSIPTTVWSAVAATLAPYVDVDTDAREMWKKDVQSIVTNLASQSLTTAVDTSGHSSTPINAAVVRAQPSVEYLVGDCFDEEQEEKEELPIHVANGAELSHTVRDTARETTTMAVSDSEKAALLDIYQSTQGASAWKNNFGWTNASLSPCNWYGVTCQSVSDSSVAVVSALKLKQNNLIGTIPDTIGRLTQLTNLELDRNDISGTLPTTIGSLTQLEVMYMYRNYDMSGTVPTQIGLLTKLRIMYLYRNKMHGTIPTQLGNCVNFERLYLYLLPRLSGTLPSQLGNFGKINRLYLNGNSLSGTLPSTLGRMVNLAFFTISMNQVSGQLPSEVGMMAKMQVFAVSQNEFTGTLPVEIYNIVTMTHLSVYGNQISGTIGEHIAQLTNLQQMLLRSNLFSGTIPTQIGTLSQLRLLNAPGCHFSGEIPTQLGLLANLEALVLSQNTRITGTITSTIGNIASLYELSISETALSGTIPTTLPLSLGHLSLYYTRISGSLPSSLGSLVSLQTLELSECLIEGTIPTQLGQLSELTSLQLAYNRLSGSIPSHIGRLTSLSSLSLSNNLFTSSLPTQIGHLTGLSALDVSHNQLSGTLSADLLGPFTRWTSLILRHNQFTGPLPVGIAEAPRLASIDVSFNPWGVEFDTFLDALYRRHGSATSSQDDFYECKDQTDSSPCSAISTLFVESTLLSGSISKRIVSLHESSIVSFRNSSKMQGSLFPAVANINMGRVRWSYIAADGTSSSLTVVQELPFPVPKWSSLDLSACPGLVGSIPESWLSFTSLQLLNVSGTGLSTHTRAMPSLALLPGTKASITRDPSLSTEPLQCPVTLLPSGGVFVLDPQYYDWSQCTCLDGSAQRWSGSCVACPPGALCRIDQPMRSVEGFWCMLGETPQCFLCPVGLCVGGSVLDSSQCAQGRTGRLCGICQEGMTVSFGSPTCSPSTNCANNGGWVVVVAIVVAGLFVMWLVASSFHRERAAHKLKASAFTEFTEQVISSRLHRILRNSRIPLVFYYQVLALVTEQVNILRQVSEAANEGVGDVIVSAFTFDFEAGTQGRVGVCMIEGLTPLNKVALSYGVPALMFGWTGLLVGTCVIARVMTRVHRQAGRGGHNFSVRARRTSVVQTDRAYNVKFLVRAMQGVLMSLLMLTYATILRTTFALLRCVDIEGHAVLFVAGEVTCYQWFRPALIALAAVLTIMPLVMAGFVFRLRDKRQAVTFTILVHPYRVWFWAAMMMMQRLLLTSILVFVIDPVTRSFSLYAATLIIFFLNWKLRPFRRRLIRLFNIGLLCCVTIIAAIDCVFATLLSQQSATTVLEDYPVATPVIYFILVARILPVLLYIVAFLCVRLLPKLPVDTRQAVIGYLAAQFTRNAFKAEMGRVRHDLRCNARAKCASGHSHSHGKECDEQDTHTRTNVKGAVNHHNHDHDHNDTGDDTGDDTGNGETRLHVATATAGVSVTVQDDYVSHVVSPHIHIDSDDDQDSVESITWDESEQETDDNCGVGSNGGIGVDPAGGIGLFDRLDHASSSMVVEFQQQGQAWC